MCRLCEEGGVCVGLCEEVRKLGENGRTVRRSVPSRRRERRGEERDGKKEEGEWEGALKARTSCLPARCERGLRLVASIYCSIFRYASTCSGVQVREGRCIITKIVPPHQNWLGTYLTCPQAVSAEVPSSPRLLEPVFSAFCSYRDRTTSS